MKSSFKHSLSPIIYFDNYELTGVIESTVSFENQNEYLILNEVYFSYVNSVSNGGALHVSYRYMERSDENYGVVNMTRVEFIMCTTDGYGGSIDIYSKKCRLEYTCAYRSRAVLRGIFARLDCWNSYTIIDMTLARNSGASTDSYGNILFSSPNPYVEKFNCSRCEMDYGTSLCSSQRIENFDAINMEYLASTENVGRSEFHIQLQDKILLRFFYFFNNKGNSIAGLNIDTTATLRLISFYSKQNEGNLFRINSEGNFRLDSGQIDVAPSQSFEQEYSQFYNTEVEEPTGQVQKYANCIPLSEDSNAHSPEVIKAFNICISIFSVATAICIGIILYKEIRLRKRLHVD